jgi:(2Fe-2S) ferredoxin/predicted O-methyltransferase YrrM
MEPFRYHVFVCTQQKPEGAPSCCARGSEKTLAALLREIQARGLEDEVMVTSCGSLGLCEWGPNMIVYPEGVWYTGVTPADVPAIVQSHFMDDTPLEPFVRLNSAELRAEILANREKRQAAMRARDVAGALPDDLNDRIRGFQESRVILTALELDVFTAIGEGAHAADAAARTGTNARALEMLLNALASMGLVSRQEGVFRNTAVTARFLAAGSRDNARPGLMHTAHLWDRWSTLTDSVRAGTAATDPHIEARGREWIEPFIAAMHRNATMAAPAVVRAVGAAGVRLMLDIGGGSGAYSIAFAKANPELMADILDLPSVTPIAQSHIEEGGVTGRVRVKSGDLRRDNLGKGYDLVFVSAICHMLDEQGNRDLLKRCRSALRTGGRVVIQDFILNEEKTGPRSAALFALNMLVGTQGGSTYSEQEYADWLGEAGFHEVRRVRLPGPAGLMIAVA